MPHYRKRHILAPFLQLNKIAKIVGIFGHRQVGKTTFIESNAKEYFSLDDDETLIKAQKEPKKFLSELKHNHSAIDECQLAPKLFPALKLAVQKNAKPGQFILSGSVRFASRKVIRESLTGRISTLEMFPMVVTELDNVPNSKFFIKALESRSYSSLANEISAPAPVIHQRIKSIEKYFNQGGLPGICFIRNAQVRKDLLEDVVKTILYRDLRLVYPTTVPDRQLFDLCREIAHDPLRSFKPSMVRRATGLSEITIKKLLQSLEAIFLIRRIPVEGDYQGDLFWFEDQVERYFFQNLDLGSSADWIGCVYRHLRAQFGYELGFTPYYFHYKTRSRAMMPIAVRQGGSVLGVYPLFDLREPGRSELTSARSFLASYPNSKVVFVTKGRTDLKVIHENVMTLSAAHAFY